MVDLLTNLECNQSTLTSMVDEDSLSKRAILAILTCSSKLIIQNASGVELSQLSSFLEAPVTQRALVYESSDGVLLQLLSVKSEEKKVSYESKDWVRENFTKAREDLSEDEFASNPHISHSREQEHRLFVQYYFLQLLHHGMVDRLPALFLKIE